MSRAALSRLDFFRKVPEDLQIKTNTGTLFSILSFITMGLLLTFHYHEYQRQGIRTMITLDSHQEDRLRINFNISLVAIPCQYASLDLSDHMGQQFVNITRHVRHFRLASSSTTSEIQRLDEVVMDTHANGIPMWGGTDQRTHDGIHYSTPLTTETFDDFMSKYELVLVNYYAPWCPYCRALNPEWERAAAQLDDHPEYAERVRMASVDCTNEKAVWLCQRAHIRAFPSMLIYVYGSTFTRFLYNGPRTAEHLLQFLDLFYRRLEPDADFAEEVNMNDDTLGLVMDVNHANLPPKVPKVKQTIPIGAIEGCEVSGSLSVNRVPGKFVLTARSIEQSMRVIGINVTHRVNHFSFGQIKSLEHLVDDARQLIPSNRYALDHVSFQAENVNITIEHFLNVVGFDHEDQRTSYFEPIQRIYEFSASSNQYNASTTLPAALFTYDISPLVIQVVQANLPLYRFLTSLCAVIGGMFTIIGLIHSGVFHALNSIEKKQQLGKLQ